MALIKCQECGKEISDTVKSCPHCGYSYKQPVLKGKINIKIVVKIIIAAVALTVFVVLFSILNRPNLKMKDLNVENNAIDTLFLLGIPDKVEDGEWTYKECGIKFYDIPVERLYFDVSKGYYYLMFDADHNDDLKDVLSKYCERTDRIMSFDVYEYDDVEVWASFYNTSGNLQIHK